MTAALELTQRVARDMLPGAQIINVSSVVAQHLPSAKFAPYAASKIALDCLSEALRLELHPRGIHVSTVSPGLVDTPIYDKVDGFERARQKIKEQVPAWLTAETWPAPSFGSQPASALGRFSADTFAQRAGALRSTSTMSKPEHVRDSEAYVESIFGPGTGEAHARFLERIQNDALREMIHRYHTLEADTSQLSLQENYLLGMCVLCSQRDYRAAALFAKTLLHLGVAQEKLLAACSRLAMWVGGLPAVDASLCVQKAIREYELEGLGSLGVWFPPELHK